MSYMVIGYHPDVVQGAREVCHVISNELLERQGFKLDVTYFDKMVDACKDFSFVLMNNFRVVGLIAGFPVHNVINGGTSMQEIVWYVYPQHRSKGNMLLRKFEENAKEIGCDSVIISSMDNEHHDRYDRLYKRYGYRMLEVQYIKEL